MNLTFLTAAHVDPVRRRITGRIVPFGEEGNPALNGSGIRLMVEAGGVVWDDMPVLRSAHHTQPVGRAVELTPDAAGIDAAFTVAKTTAGDDALTLAAERLQAGLSVECEVPEGLTASADGLYTLTAANPARLTAVALVETPAFRSAQVSEVAATKKEDTPMSESQQTQLAAAEVPDNVVSDLVTALNALVESQTQEADPASEGGDAGGEAAAQRQPLPGRQTSTLTAATSVTREPFPYGYDGAEGVSLFRDLVAAKVNNDSAAAIRAEKANSMMAEYAAAKGPRGKQLIATDKQSQAIITAANEPVVRSTLVVPNVYDTQRYVEELVNPRTIADNVPGVSISAPNPQVIPAFSSSAADGGSGEMVVASTEGSLPAQGEVATTSVTVTPVWYNGLLDVSRQAVDAATPATDALMIATLMNSYNETTESAAVTAILANGTAGTDAAHNADADTKYHGVQKTIRLEMATMRTTIHRAPSAALLASDVYLASVAANNPTTDEPLYKFLSDRMQVVNDVASIGASEDDMPLAIYNKPGLCATKLTATKVVIVHWPSVIRYESPVQQFTLNEVIAPAGVRFAVGGYFAQRTLRALGVRYYSVLAA